MKEKKKDVAPKMTGDTRMCHIWLVVSLDLFLGVQILHTHTHTHTHVLSLLTHPSVHSQVFSSSHPRLAALRDANALVCMQIHTHPLCISTHSALHNGTCFVFVNPYLSITHPHPFHLYTCTVLSSGSQRTEFRKTYFKHGSCRGISEEKIG